MCLLIKLTEILTRSCILFEYVSLSVYTSSALECYDCTGLTEDDKCTKGGEDLTGSTEKDIRQTCSASDDVCFVSARFSELLHMELI